MKPHDWEAFKYWGVVPPEPESPTMIRPLGVVESEARRASPVLTPAPRPERCRWWAVLVLALVAVVLALVAVTITSLTW